MVCGSAGAGAAAVGLFIGTGTPDVEETDTKPAGVYGFAGGGAGLVRGTTVSGLGGTTGLAANADEDDGVGVGGGVSEGTLATDLTGGTGGG